MSHWKSLEQLKTYLPGSSTFFCPQFSSPFVNKMALSTSRVQRRVCCSQIRWHKQEEGFYNHSVLDDFSNRAHAVPLFTSSKILPVNMLYIETVSSIMFDLSCLNVPTNISNLFTKASEKHNHETRFSSSRNFYINRSRLIQNHGSFAKFGAKLWNSIGDEFRQLPKRAFEKHIKDM